MNISDLSDDDVITYTPGNSWCREGWAIVKGRCAVDTYWRNGGTDDHILTKEELSTAEFKFNLQDYEKIDEYKSRSAAWESRDEADRESIPHQHGLQRTWLIRAGSSPSDEMIIKNARAAMDAARDDLRAATSQLESATYNWAMAQLRNGGIK